MLAPFRHVTDSGYEWLQNVFIQYLEKWKVSIDSREGFTNGERIECSWHSQHTKG